MKLTLQLKLAPTADQCAQLKATVQRFNEAANWLAKLAFERKTANKILLQKLFYYDLRSKFGVPAQVAVRCISQVCEAYKRDKAKQPTFRSLAAMPYDQRIMSFKGIDRVSLLTLDGRILVPFVMGQYQRERFGYAKGQADLVFRNNGWFLLVTVDVPDGTKIPSTDFIGVDLGVANIATDSDGRRYSGETVERVRAHNLERRSKLQTVAALQRNRGKRPRSARRALRRLAGKEARFRKDANHCISKSIVAKAKGTARGIALENLKGIRERTRFRKRQRARMSGWSFFQLRSFIEYKARLEGVEVHLVDPRDTSRTCPECGYCAKSNRRSQSEFRCRRCGHTANADAVGARNIRARAFVMKPMVSDRSHGSDLVA